ncbi:EI24 domain-containing protein [Neotabrizicola sp. sgz301269]|uniref:EI24 domain-containing protein n=1 Tax=Neotabrizicola sp. sgz301269 TaxID=3276282 RepID=UPI00376FF7D8
MIFQSFGAAVGQMGDPRFRRVLVLGVLLAFALLAVIYALFLLMIATLTPDLVELPFLGPISGLHQLLGWASLFFMLALSVFLMIPAAAAFAGLFTDDVAQAVEEVHYPFLPPARSLGWAEGLRASINLIGLLVLVNLAALMSVLVIGPFAPVLFWAANGWLLGREYFMLVALRRLPADEAKALRSRNGFTVWMAGALMAAPLSVPLVNLLIPVLGTATFTHIFHKLMAEGR